MSKKGISFRRLLKSFGYALNGLRWMVVREQNAKIHILAFLCVIVAGWFFGISASEWIAIVIVAGMVFTAETFNTSIETLSDKFSPEYDESIKRVKDVAAGAVLVTAIIAVVVGLIIFLPKIF
ncbi:MAG: diacylglycerol kinase family protein [Tannerella sp.]|jgi:diacylglycerol kinase (ATP)|nr:diacylglycerol kinase family protein [Tannerella sp.]